MSVLYPDAPVSCTDELSRCEGDYAVNCGGLNDSPPYFTDCERMGGTCDIRPDNIADCVVVDSCSEPDPTGSENYASGCVGDDYYYCAGGKGFGNDCTKFAADCEMGDNGYGCFYSVTSCGADSTSCSGDTIVQCTDGERFQYDCGSTNLECTIDTYSYCLAPGCSGADADDCTESCSGSELTFCYGGAPVTIDCQDYGFDSCKEVEDVYALCTNL
jgi:hypothetical protein